MEKLAENEDEILYVNKNNPFGVEKIRELTRKVKEQLEVDEDRFNTPAKNPNGPLIFPFNPSNPLMIQTRRRTRRTASRSRRS